MKSLVTAILLLALIGCTGRKTIPISETTLPTMGKYETVWVNPKVLYSDSLYTLISSERLDSVFVKTSEHSLGETMPTVAFQVAPPSCTVKAEIMDGSHFLAELFTQRLQQGQYKITFDRTKFRNFLPLHPERIAVRVTVCGVATTDLPLAPAPAQ